MDIKTEKYWLMEGNCLDRMKEIPDHSVDMILCDLPYTLARFHFRNRVALASGFEGWTQWEVCFMEIKTEKYWLMEGDCLDRMKEIPDHSVDMILCDLPYGVTDCEWDSVIPFDRLWEQYQRVLKPYGNCLLFGTQPFISDVINSNKQSFSHVWYWIKNSVTGALNARRQPLRCIEEVAVFVCNIPSKTFGGGYSKAREYLREQKRLSGLSCQQLRDLDGPMPKVEERKAVYNPQGVRELRLDALRRWLFLFVIHLLRHSGGSTRRPESICVNRNVCPA